MSVKEKVAAVRKRTEALDEEVHLAISLHEAWKPAAFDAELHDRLGFSYATNTFEVVRLALRREMIMALMRIWDRHEDGLRIHSVAAMLRERAVADRLVADATSHLRRPPEPADAATLVDADVLSMLAEIQSDESFREGERIRTWIAEVISMLEAADAEEETLRRGEFLKDIRDRRFAHRDLRDVGELPKPDAFDRKVENLYQDTLRLLHLLKLIAEGSSYDPSQAARLRQKNAELFWMGVKGERTEGHPEYRVPPHNAHP